MLEALYLGTRLEKRCSGSKCCWVLRLELAWSFLVSESDLRRKYLGARFLFRVHLQTAGRLNQV